LNRFGSSDFAEKIVRILDLGICYKYSRILFIQQIAYLSYILAQVVDFTCNLVRILVCDFIVELLADPELDKTIVVSPPPPASPFVEILILAYCMVEK
jgi:hypothetical protein